MRRLMPVTAFLVALFLVSSTIVPSRAALVEPATLSALTADAPGAGDPDHDGLRDDD